MFFLGKCGENIGRIMSLEIVVKNDLTFNQRIKFLIADRSDFAAFYQVVLIQSYASLKLEEGDIVVDGGANCGFFTLLASKAVGGSGKVVAVEPDYMNFQKLERNVRLNHLTNVILQRKALWNTPGMLLELHGKGVDTRVKEDRTRFLKPTGKFVETTTLDKILDDHNLVGCLKIKADIEGAELEALRPSMNAIRSAEQICVEAHGKKSMLHLQHVFSSLGFRTTLYQPEKFSRFALKIMRHPILAMKTEIANSFATSQRILMSLVPNSILGNWKGEELLIMHGRRLL
jgi:FkbM family methyltransferase